MDSTLKRRGNDRFHVVSTWNPSTWCVFRDIVLIQLFHLQFLLVFVMRLFNAMIFPETGLTAALHKSQKTERVFLFDIWHTAKQNKYCIFIYFSPLFIPIPKCFSLNSVKLLLTICKSIQNV